LAEGGGEGGESSGGDEGDEEPESDEEPRTRAKTTWTAQAMALPPSSSSY